MMSFRKLSARGAGKLLRRYFTEDRPEPETGPGHPGIGHNGGPILEPGERLTAYYTGRDSRATWRPDMPVAVARAFGIDPTRMPKDQDLDRLFEARRADTGEAWSEHERKISAYDFTFSPHKSIALAAEFAPTQAEAAAIRNAVWRANDAAMRYVARELGWARKGDGGKDGADPGAVGWASFYHYTARPTLAVRDGRKGETYLADAPVAGDPFDHVHNALFNLVVTEEGRIGSLDTNRLHARVHEFGAFGQAVLADELRRLGVRIGYDKNEQAVVVEAVPASANDAFSKSRKQVLRGAKAFAVRQGLDWDEISAEKKFDILRESAVAERLSKQAGGDDRALWRAQAEEIGWAHATVLDEVRHRHLGDVERFDLAYAFAARHLETDFHTAAVVDHDRLRLHAARGLIGTGIRGGADDIDRVVELLETRGIELRGEHVALVTGVTDDKVRVTNTAQIRIEQNLAERSQRASLDRSGALSTAAIRTAVAASGLNFDDEHGRAQLAAIYALGQGGALTALTGVAGSGKTTLLRPLVAAWKADTRYASGGREVIGVATAWRQADALRDPDLDISSVVDRTYALHPLMQAIASGEFAPTRNTVLVVDEVSQIGPRPMLELLELQARTGMTIKVLGDREQAQSIEAGDTIEIFRRALSNEALPELLSTVRQVGRTAAEGAHLREIAGLFRGGELDEYATPDERKKHRVEEVTRALGMKRDDGTAMLVGGDQDQVVGEIADFYLRRRDILRAAGSKRGVTVSVPTNEDVADVSRAIRDRLKARGEVGADEVVYQAIDQRGEEYALPVATGDRVRLYRKTWGMVGDKGGWVGSNGDVVEVLGTTDTGPRLRTKDGRVADVEWWRMTDPKTGRLLLGFGHALTIDAAQGITSDEHINAMPRGSAGVTGFKAYVAESRARGATWTMIAEAAVHEAVRRGRALGDASPVTAEDLWQRAAEDLAAKPYKALGMDLSAAARATWERAVDSFIRRSQRLQAMAADGVDPGQEARRNVRSLVAERRMAGHEARLNGAARGNGAALHGVGEEVAAAERGRRVRDFVRGQGAAPAEGAGASRPGEGRRMAQAEAVRKTLAGQIAGLDEALSRNAANLSALGGSIDAHLRGLRAEAGAARRDVETVARRPSSSPSPGM